MSRIFFILALVVGWVGSIRSATVLQVSVSDFTGNVETNISVRLTYLNSLSGTTFITPGPQTKVTDTNGQAWFSNVVAGYYQLSILSTNPVAAQRLLVTNYAGTLDAAALTTTTQTGGSSVSWTANASDLRYPSLFTGDGVTVSTNSNRLQLTITGGTGPTNGYTGSQVTQAVTGLVPPWIALSNVLIGTAATNHTTSASNALQTGKQPASTTLTNLAGTGAITNLAPGDNITFTTNAGIITIAGQAGGTNSGLTGAQVTNAVQGLAWLVAPGSITASIDRWQGGAAAAYSITADDWERDFIDSYMQTSGIKMSFYYVGSLALTNTGRVFSNHWQGHEVGWHTIDHPTAETITNWSAADWWTDSTNGLSLMRTNFGLRPWTFAYPYGITNAHSRGVLTNLFLCARGYPAPGVNWDGSDRYDLLIETNLPAQGFQPVSDLVALTAMTNYIANCVASNGWGVYLIHSLEATNNANGTTRNVWTNRIEYLLRQTNLWVATVDDVRRYELMRDASGVVVSNAANAVISLTITNGLTTNEWLAGAPLLSVDLTLPPAWETNGISASDLAGALRVDCIRTNAVRVYAAPNRPALVVRGGYRASAQPVKALRGTFPALSQVNGFSTNLYLTNAFIDRPILRWAGLENPAFTNAQLFGSNTTLRAGGLFATNATLRTPTVSGGTVTTATNVNAVLTGDASWTGSVLSSYSAGGLLWGSWFQAGDGLYDMLTFSTGDTLIGGSNIVEFGYLDSDGYTNRLLWMSRENIRIKPGSATIGQVLTATDTNGSLAWSNPPAGTGSIDASLFLDATNGIHYGVLQAINGIKYGTSFQLLPSPDILDGLQFNSLSYGDGYSIGFEEIDGPLTITNSAGFAWRFGSNEAPRIVATLEQVTNAATVIASNLAGNALHSLTPIGVTNSGYTTNLTLELGNTNAPLHVVTGIVNHIHITIVGHAQGRRAELLLAGAGMAGWNKATNINITWGTDASMPMRWAGRYTNSLLYSNQWLSIPMTCLGGGGYTNLLMGGVAYE